MGVSEEKSDVTHHLQTADVGQSATKDVETPMSENIIPQSDDQYDVTFKTWCVVIVSYHHSRFPLYTISLSFLFQDLE